MEKANEMEDEGPEYDIDSATLKKFRRLASKGLAKLSRNDRQQYAEAVTAAVLSAQRASLRREGNPAPRPNCASGTTHNTGEAIHKALRAQHRAALLACPSQERRARSPSKWQEMYDAAMAEKRKREAQPPTVKLSNRRERAEAHLRAARARLEAVA
jgi:hypothetical protein